MSNSDKEIGAIKTKPKHSTNKNILEKDKSNFLVSSPKGRNIQDRRSTKVDEKNARQSLEERKKIDSLNVQEKKQGPLLIDDEKIFNDILDDKSLSDSLEKEKIEDLFNNLVVDDKKLQNEVLGNKNSLKDSHKVSNIPILQEAAAVNKVVNIVKLEDSGVVPKVVKDEEVGGLLGAVCVRKVERFSELLSNLCSPCEADILFEDILVENGIDGNPVSKN